VGTFISYHCPEWSERKLLLLSASRAGFSFKVCALTNPGNNADAARKNKTRS